MIRTYGIAIDSAGGLNLYNVKLWYGHFIFEHGCFSFVCQPLVHNVFRCVTVYKKQTLIINRPAVLKGT